MRWFTLPYWFIVLFFLPLVSYAQSPFPYDAITKAGMVSGSATTTIVTAPATILAITVYGSQNPLGGFTCGFTATTMIQMQNIQEVSMGNYGSNQLLTHINCASTNFTNINTGGGTLSYVITYIPRIDTAPATGGGGGGASCGTSSTTPCWSQDAGDLSFAASIIITILSFALVALIFNSFSSKKKWGSY